MNENSAVTGTIRIYQLPEPWDDEEQYRTWWAGWTVGGVMIRHPRMSAREKQQYLVCETHNILTTAGRNSLLNYIGSQTSTNQPFGKYMALGSGLIVAASPADTALANELIRKLPSTVFVAGTSVDLTMQLLTTDIANTDLTNAGLFGGSGATGTSGSGTLYTHALIIPNFFKAGSLSYNVDYVLNLL